MKKNKYTSNSVRKFVLTALAAAPVAFAPLTLKAIDGTTGTIGAGGGAQLTAVMGPSAALVKDAATNGYTYTYVGSTGTFVVLPGTTTKANSVFTWAGLGDASAAGNPLSIAATETLHFTLPTADSSVLNKVTGGVLTTIAGTLSSDGNIYLVNPAGITVTGAGVVSGTNVGLSTVIEDDNATDAYFLANGTLKQLTTVATAAGTTTGVINVQQNTKTLSTGKLDTTLSAGKIYLVAKTVNVAGTVNGDLYVRASNAGTTTLGFDQGGAADNVNDNLLNVTGSVDINSAGAVVLNASVENVGGNADSLQNVITKNLTVVTGSATVAGAAVSTVGDAGIKIGDVTLGAAKDGVVTIDTGSKAAAAVTLSGDFNKVSVTNGAAVGINRYAADTNGLVLGTTTATGAITIVDAAAAGGAPAYGIAGKITTTGKITAAGLTIAGGVGNAISDITLSNGVEMTGAGNLQLQSNTGSISVTDGKMGTGNIQLAAATLTKSATYSGSGNLILGASTSPTLSVTSTDGNVTIAATPTAATSLSIKAGGNIAQSAALTGAGAMSFETTGTASTIILNTAGNTASGALTFIGAPGTSSTQGLQYTESIAGGTLLIDTLNVTGNATFTQNAAANTILFGQAYDDTITVGGNLTIAVGANAAASVTDVANNMKVTGALILNTGLAGSSVTLNNPGLTIGAIGNSTASTYIGDLTVKAAAISVAKQSVTGTMSLESTSGNIATTDTATITGLLTEKSAGSITNSGALTLGAGITATAATGFTNSAALAVTGASTVTATTGNITNSAAWSTTTATLEATAGSITSTSGALTITGVSSLKTAATGSIAIDNDSNAITGAVTINSDVKDVTVKNTIAGGTTLNVAAGKAATGTTTITQVTTGVPGNVALSGDFNVVTFTNPSNSVLGGNLTITETNDITLKDTTLNVGIGTLSVTTANGKITLGNITDSSVGLITLTAGGANAGIVQTAGTKITSNGGLTLSSAAGLTVANAGNVIGGSIAVTTGANGSASVNDESATDLGAVSIDGTGGLTVTSTGNVTQSGVITASGSTSGVISVTTTAGTITLGGNNALKKQVALKAVGDITFNQTGADDLKVGTIGTLGKLALTSTGSNITQDSGTVVWCYDTATISSNAANKNISLTGSDNNFGGLILNAGTGTIAITENNTLKIKNVTASAITAQSNISDIIQTAGAGEKIAVTGNSFFKTDSGKVELKTATNAIAGLKIVSKNDSSVVSTTAVTLNDGFFATGAFTLDSTGTNIGQAAGSTVITRGSISLTAGVGNILLNEANNEFGGFKFSAKDVTIKEKTTLNVLGGSLANGTTKLTSADQIITVGGGIVNLLGNDGTAAVDTTLTAPNGIILSSGWNIMGDLLLDTTKADLRLLSVAGNLNGKTPAFATGGSYVTDGAPTTP
jgi:filamentous hemagglutinin family protein